MQKTWMIIIIIASLIALAGAGFIVFRKVAPAAVADKKLISNERNAISQNSSGKRVPRKSKPPNKFVRKIIPGNTASARSSTELLEKFSSMDEAERIRFIATLFSYEPSLLSLALSDKSKNVRINATRFISCIPENQIDISPFLTMALDDESSEVREAARNVIDSLNDDNTMLRIMGTSLNSKYADSRLKCASELINLGVPREDLKKHLLKALNDDDRKVIDTALQTASSLWDREFISRQDAIGYISGH